MREEFVLKACPDITDQMVIVEKSYICAKYDLTITYMLVRFSIVEECLLRTVPYISTTVFSNGSFQKREPRVSSLNIHKTHCFQYNCLCCH